MTDKTVKNALRGATLALSVAAGALCPLALDSILSPAALAQSARVDISIFFDELAPHGRWVQSQRHGFVFLPANIDADWRPYTLGRWVNTEDFGWYWVSDEAFGWATYHYGRWGYDNTYGWFWVPGSVWAPAWVSWRSSDEHIGWAPLPPPARGYAFATNVGPVDVGAGAWCFVRENDFLAPNLTTVIIERRRTPEIYRIAQPLGSVRLVNNVVVNRVVDIRRIERVTSRQIEVYRINDRDRPGRADVNQTTISAYRPTLSTAQPRQRPNNVGRADQLANSPRSADVNSDARGREQGRKVRQEADAPSSKRGDPTVGSGETGRQAEPRGAKGDDRDSDRARQAEPKGGKGGDRDDDRNRLAEPKGGKGGDGDDRTRQAEPKGGKGGDREVDRTRQAEPKGGKGGDRDDSRARQAAPKGGKDGRGDDGAAARQAEPKGGKGEARDSDRVQQADPRDRGPGRGGASRDGDEGRVTKGAAGRGGGAGGNQGAGGKPETPPPAASRSEGGPGGGSPGGRADGPRGGPSRDARPDAAPGPQKATRGESAPGIAAPSGRGGGGGGSQGAGGPPPGAGRGDGGGGPGGGSGGGRGPSGPGAGRGDGPGPGGPGGGGGGPGGGDRRPDR